MKSNSSMAQVAGDILESARKKGVRFWAEHGQLHYKGPKGALAPEDLARIRAFKQQLIAALALDATSFAEPELEVGSGATRAPLSFTQLAHWQTYQLDRRPAIRQICTATRLRGKLQVDVLKHSLDRMVQRHHALRTRIVRRGGIPEQEVVDTRECNLAFHDLSTRGSLSREIEIHRHIEEMVLQPIDTASESLFGARLLKLDEQEHALILALEHMISDMFSMGILLRDLMCTYRELSRGEPVSLPEILVQFTDYALWQRKVQGIRNDIHGAYWRERLVASPRLALPDDEFPAEATTDSWATVPVRIDATLKARLQDWCRARRTTLVMAMFTVYVALVLRWCDREEAIIRYQSDGRHDPKIENTIGFFAASLYVPVQLSENDTFAELLARVTDAYCVAHQRADHFYWAAQLPRPEFTHNPLFNWVSNVTRTASPHDSGGDAVECSPIHFVHPMRRNMGQDIEPFVLLFETPDEVVGDLYYPQNRFAASTMERFGRGLLKLVQVLLDEPNARARSIDLVEM